MASLYEALRRSLELEELVVQVTVIDPGPAPSALGRKLLIWPDGRTLGGLGSAALDEAAVALVRQSGEKLTTGPLELATADGDRSDGGIRSERGKGSCLEVFVEVFGPPLRLVIVGAVHVAIHLIHFAQRLGFRCIVVDAREAFATAERFPHADELIVGWPAEVLAGMPINDGTYCVFLTHDPKLDDPALKVALERGAHYVGALGSTRTHAKRVGSLGELGVANELIERIHAPIGVDLGGRKPEEIALSIAAELVQSRGGRSRAGARTTS